MDLSCRKTTKKQTEEAPSTSNDWKEQNDRIFREDAPPENTRFSSNEACSFRQVESSIDERQRDNMSQGSSLGRSKSQEVKMIQRKRRKVSSPQIAQQAKLRVSNQRPRRNSKDVFVRSLRSYCRFRPPVVQRVVDFPMLTLCYTCGEKSVPDQMCTAYLYDSSDPKLPQFPSLDKNRKGNDAPTRRRISVCTFCYHQLMYQWYRYESYSEYVPLVDRIYNTINFICYVCGVGTHRKRIHSISAENFPMLSKRQPREGALALYGGKCFVACRTCFQTLNRQWKEYERMKVPLELRNYNWIMIPLPPEVKQILQSQSQTDKSESTNVEEAEDLSITNQAEDLSMKTSKGRIFFLRKLACCNLKKVTSWNVRWLHICQI
ncbi:Uncharacterised protein g3208 [Pycnogonum litorale]